MKKRIIALADWKPNRNQYKLVKQVLDTARLTYGPFSKQLEKEFAKLHGKKHAIFMNSGTSALFLALKYCKDKYGWKDGDEVLVPSVTFVATVNVVLQNNLKPVLVDVDVLSFNIDPEFIEEKITKKTRAIIPVSLLGHPCQIDRIMRIARKNKLKVIEDSCETMFVKYKGKPVGARADFACYSSYFAHIISTGVGGFLTTDDKEAERYIRSLIWHGRDDRYLSIDDAKKLTPKERIDATFRFDKIGYSLRLTEFEAALGLDEVRNYKKIIKKRNDNANYLSYKLGNFIDIELPITEPGVENAWMFYSLWIADGRDNLQAWLENYGVQTRKLMPLTNQPVYKGMIKEEDYPAASQVNRYGLLIPCHHFLTKDDLDYIVDTIRRFYSD